MVNTGDIPDLKRMQIMQTLLESCVDGTPERGVMPIIAARFGVSKRTISRIWSAAAKQRGVGEVIDVSSIRTKRVYKRKHEIDYPKIEAVDKEERKTIHSLADALGISKATVGRWAKDHLLRPHSSALKPLLTTHNMPRRLSFGLQSIHFDREVNTLKFKLMENIVHIDEKWFYITTKSCKYYLTPMEADPLRVTQSKSFIPKVMFLCAVSRPIYDVNGQLVFDGKIGI